MADVFTKAERSRVMAAVKGKDTEPEMIVRRAVHAMGYRYRLHDAKLPGKPDLVFAGRRKVIFVHGCFWHGHATGGKGCRGARVPKARRDYWGPKLQRNRERDERHRRKLRRMGYGVLTVWECQTTTPKRERLAERLRRFLES